MEAKGSVTGSGINPKRLALCSGCRLSVSADIVCLKDTQYFLLRTWLPPDRHAGFPCHFNGENVASLHDFLDYTNEFGLPLHLHFKDQTNSVFKGTAGLEEQWVQRTRGTLETEELWV